MKFFNTAGPNKVDKHYSLDPLSRLDLDALLKLIDQERYFVLHAPRQTGKTTMLFALMHLLNQRGDYHCIYVNVEPAQVSRENVDAAMSGILSAIAREAAYHLGDDFLKNRRKHFEQEEEPSFRLFSALTEWAEQSPKPIVLLIDEIDSLIGDTLVSILRQLRSGYAQRPGRFPQSVILCGVRDVRDYRIHTSSGKEPVTGGSAFNIKAKSLRLGNFNQDETCLLLQQHTDETGQIFTDEAVESIWTASQGQPWLVNALADEIVSELVDDQSIGITSDMVAQARETLIQRQDTHLDQLIDKLREPRVHRVIAPILAGDPNDTDASRDDQQYVEDLGLIVTKPNISIANPIYQEVIPRALTASHQATLAQETQWYVHHGLLDIPKLLAAFQDFFRQHSEFWVERFHYKEAGPQLLLQSFLQRIVNGGGRIEREYGLGRGRTDLLVLWPHETGTQRIVMELKLLHGARDTAIDQSLPQVAGYMDRCDADEGHLILFDRRDRRWEQKIFQEDRIHQNRTIKIWGM